MPHYRIIDVKPFRLVALLSAQGTACAETVLVGDDDTPKARANIEAKITPGQDAPIPGSWTDCSGNEALCADPYGL